ncbi:ankyrin repeat domain-containing protein [Dyella agri]|uniref:Ankyrin repeat domain-containing protein n=1 Tax=Dyella agri TaxID=1926869 RepID=A0ABW8KCX7_9GAMM
MPSPLTDAELLELKAAFADLINYESDDPEKPIEPLSYRAPDGDSCLHVASHRGNLRAVQLLVRAGLDINAPGDMGYTPLHYAATAEVIEFLLANGASPTIKNEFGSSPIGWKDRS